jgi:hypothetical protein
MSRWETYSGESCAGDDASDGGVAGRYGTGDRSVGALSMFSYTFWLSYAQQVRLSQVHPTSWNHGGQRNHMDCCLRRPTLRRYRVCSLGYINYDRSEVIASEDTV